MQRDRMKLSFLRQINACVCLDRYEEVGGYCATVSEIQRMNPYERILWSSESYSSITKSTP
ncbi:hypothetical protein CS543_04225 [Porphyromonas gingivalis]|nr:hypothetical protein CS550_02275 [Porphyromonas gingivalis]ATR99856.1 hypothetical protein CS549_01415 [Porphyromonas gingivalis]ATS01689.1 hypothetical protein CS059_00885 [Porphyromonas gingivalis]ATS10132.1 hypothetical protein CS543_04225 [Porphyromonas gingivalis]PDP46565.1 hypothetical protein CLI82_06110 [Porphyromonas gingivalis]